jgi:hypothetical protein
MKPFILIVRGPARWLAYLEDEDADISLSRQDKERLTKDYEAGVERFNRWIKEQEIKGIIQISSRLTSEQRIMSGESEIEFELLEVIEGAKVLQIIFALAESWEYMVKLIADCPLPSTQYSIEIREVQHGKAPVL